MPSGNSYNPVIRWVHLSDLHMKSTGADYSHLKFFLPKLLADLKEFNPHFIVFSGDISFSGKLREFEKANQLFFKELVCLEHISNDSIFLSPGNHDVDRKFIESCPKGIRNFDGQNNLTNFFNKSKEFKTLLTARTEYIKFARRFGLNHKHDKDFPICSNHGFKLKKKKISIVSLSTSILSNLNLDSKSKETDYGRLAIGHFQVESALGRYPFKKPDLSLVVTHHPISWLNEWDRKEIFSYFSKYFDFHLFGHSHYQRFEERINPTGHIVSVQSGSIYSDYNNEHVYTQFTWSLNNNKIDISERTYDKDKIKWRNCDESFAVPLGRKTQNRCEVIDRPLNIDSFKITISDEFDRDLLKLKTKFETIKAQLQKVFDNHLNYFRHNYENSPIPLEPSVYLLISKSNTTIEFHRLIKCGRNNVDEFSDWNRIIDTYRKLTYFAYRQPENNGQISAREFASAYKWHQTTIEMIKKYFRDKKGIELGATLSKSKMIHIINSYIEQSMQKLEEAQYYYKHKREFSPEIASSQIVSNLECSLMSLHKIVASYYPGVNARTFLRTPS